MLNMIFTVFMSTFFYVPVFHLFLTTKEAKDGANKNEIVKEKKVEKIQASSKTQIVTNGTADKTPVEDGQWFKSVVLNGWWLATH